MKFYRLEATGILAGPEKLSTILITSDGETTEFARWKLFSFNAAVSITTQTPVYRRARCGKAEDGGG